MGKGKFKNFKIKDHTFALRYEDDYPEIPHIFARHRKDIDDVAYIFFNGEHRWNKEKRRMEVVLGTEGLWYFWINEEEKVLMVISCHDEYAW